MTIRSFQILARPLMAAGAFALAALGAVAPSSWAQGVVTLTGATSPTCTYTQITTLPNGNVTVTCSAAANTATIAFGTAIGSLSTAADPSSAQLPVSCSGSCTGVQVALSVTSPAAGVSVTSTLSFGAAGLLNATVNGSGPLAPGNATIALQVTAAGAGVTTTPAVNGATINGTVPIVDATQPGSLAFSPASATVIEGGAIQTVNVTRTGAGAAAPTVTVDYACTVAPVDYLPAITPSATGTLTWLNNDATAKPITINPTIVPTTTAGSVTCALTNPTGGATSSTTPYVLTVSKNVAGTCTTVADQTVDLSTGITFRGVVNVGPGPGKSAAVKFKPNNGTKMSALINTSWLVPGTKEPTAVQVNIAKCPGDFTTVLGPRCGPTYKTSDKSDFVSAVDRVESWYCDKLTPDTVYYFNVRYYNPATNLSGCAYTSCGAYVDISYN